MSKEYFKTNTLLKDLVGRDLINDDNIAVIELVKNAYDAKSKSVLIRFEKLAHGVTTPSSRLVIMDKGVGMTAADIKDKWLNIAYSEKKNQTLSGAYFAGNKGVGRFSCDRLGAHLEFLTRKPGGTIQKLSVHWPDFEVEGKKDLTIQQIGMSLSTVSPEQAERTANLEMPRSGTVLVISQLRSEWNRARLLTLKRHLEKFLNPNQAFLQKHFEIELCAEGLEDSDADLPYVEAVNGPVRNQIFSNLAFKTTFIEVAIPADGKTVTTTLSHDGEKVFRLKENNLLNLKHVCAVIYYLNSYKKAYFKRETGLRSIDFGSIFLFLNGFRIAPYGDRGDDWLGLEVRKGQGSMRYLSSRDLIGRIEVTDDEQLFKPISSREGLKRTPAFVELRDTFALEAIRRLEKFVVDGLAWDSIPPNLRETVRKEDGLDWRETPEEYVESWDKKRDRIALSMMAFVGSSPENVISFWFNPALLEAVLERRGEDVKKLLSDVGQFDSSQMEPGLKSGLARIRRLLEDREKDALAARTEASELRVAVAKQGLRLQRLQQETETYHRQTLFLQSVTSLDVKRLLSFHHEISLNANTVDNYLGRCFRALREGGDPRDIMTFLEKISLANKKITAIAQFATKANFAADTQKEMTDVPTFIEQYIVNVARDFVGSGLSFDVTNKVSERFDIKVRRIELSIVLDNIISNSVKAQARHMQVTLELNGKNSLRLSFRDDGRGLHASIGRPGDIFSMGVTTTSGSGLGLYHVEQIIRSLGGSVQAIPSSPEGGLEIRVEVSR